MEETREGGGLLNGDHPGALLQPGQDDPPEAFAPPFGEQGSGERVGLAGRLFPQPYTPITDRLPSHLADDQVAEDVKAWGGAQPLSQVRGGDGDGEIVGVLAGGEDRREAGVIRFTAEGTQDQVVGHAGLLN